jgi:molecular chaperone DnaK
MAPWRPTLGIDFGTSNTSAAWTDQRGKIHPVPITTVDQQLPSVIWFGSPEKYVVGASARQKLIDDPTNTIFGFKRFVGRSMRSDYINRIRDRFPYKLVEDEDGTVAVEVHGQLKPLRQLIAFVFQRIVELANASSGQRFEQCVLSVPSHYSYRQRQVVRTAAEAAGLNVRALVNEPTAAALFLTKQTPTSGTAMIFDLGGGTFDTTLIAIDGYVVKVLGSGGDAFLGGIDFDERIARALAQQFEAEHGVEIQGQKVVMLRLMFAAEMAKIMLSHVEQAPVRVIYAAEKNGKPLDLHYVVNQDGLAQIVAPLVERCVGACEDLLQRVNMKPSDVGELILVGAQTRTPILRRRLYSLFKGDPNRNRQPEMSVTTGAALLGRMLDMPAGPALVDVSSMPVWASAPGVEPQLAVPPQSVVPHRGRVSLPHPLPASSPWSVVFYEALTASDVDRDILGTVRVDPSQAPAPRGPFYLEVTMNGAFTLEVSLVGADGKPARLPLVPFRPR